MMTKKSYNIGIFLNLFLFFSCILLLIIYIIKHKTNSLVENQELMKYGLFIILFAICNIIYGLNFIIKSKFKVPKKLIYSILLLIGIFPPLYIIFPIFQFTIFRNMVKTTNFRKH